MLKKRIRIPFYKITPVYTLESVGPPINDDYETLHFIYECKCGQVHESFANSMKLISKDNRK